MQTFSIFSNVVATEFVSLKKQLLHEQLLQAASAARHSCSRLVALQCQERWDYAEEKERLAATRNPASHFIRKQSLAFSILCEHFLHIRLLVISPCGKKMKALELGYTQHLHTFKPYFLLFHLISYLHCYGQVLSSQAMSGIPPLTILLVQHFVQQLLFNTLAWMVWAKGMWLEHRM